MTDAEKLRALVLYRFEQAHEALTSADANLDRGLVRSAANRAYYAMFYAVMALLATRQEEISPHSGAIARFDQYYIKSGSSCVTGRAAAHRFQRIMDAIASLP